MILYYNCNPWSFKSVLNMNSYELYVNFFVKFKEFLIICQRNFMVYTCFNETDQSFLTNNLHNYTSLKFKRRIDGCIKYLQCADKIFVDIRNILTDIFYYGVKDFVHLDKFFIQESCSIGKFE